MSMSSRHGFRKKNTPDRTREGGIPGSTKARHLAPSFWAGGLPNSVWNSVLENRGAAPGRSNATGIPEAIKRRFETRSGFSLDDVKVHYHSSKPAGLEALAYTQGNQVYMGPGQEKHLEHELGHVVQQKAGLVRETTRINGLPANDDPALEAHPETVNVQALHPPSAPVVQRLRLRLNDEVGENGHFNRLRQVPVSPPAHVQQSDTSASPRLQRELTPNVENVPWAERLHQAVTSKYEGYGPAANGPVFTLGQNEDIIFEGHGSNVGVEDYTPAELAKKAAAVLLRCGYSDDQPWAGRVVLLACDTGQFAQAVAQSLGTRVGFPVSVIGTQRNISVNQEPNGAAYAEDDWQPGDVGVPVNLAAIVAFEQFLETQIEPLTKDITTAS